MAVKAASLRGLPSPAMSGEVSSSQDLLTGLLTKRVVGPFASDRAEPLEPRRPQRPPISRAAALRAVPTNYHDGFDPVAHLVVVSELEARPADRALNSASASESPLQPPAAIAIALRPTTAVIFRDMALLTDNDGGICRRRS